MDGDITEAFQAPLYKLIQVTMFVLGFTTGFPRLQAFTGTVLIYLMQWMAYLM
jgi:hypothetical protein